MIERIEVGAPVAFLAAKTRTRRSKTPLRQPEVMMASRIGRRTAERRAHLGIAQKELAALCGVSVAMISKYERGLSEVPAAQLWRLSQALGLAIDDFFEEVPPNPDANLRTLTSLGH